MTKTNLENVLKALLSAGIPRQKDCQLILDVITMVKAEIALPDHDLATMRDSFDKAGYWPNEVMWKAWQQAWKESRWQAITEAVAVADRAANDYENLSNTQAENASDRISNELARIRGCIVGACG